MKRKFEGNNFQTIFKKIKICRKRCNINDDLNKIFKRIKLGHEVNNDKKISAYNQYRRDILVYT